MAAATIDNGIFETLHERSVWQSLDVHMQVIHAVERWDVEAKPVI
jgi:hypothetical protein